MKGHLARTFANFGVTRRSELIREVARRQEPKAGDEVVIEAEGPDTIAVRRARHDIDATLGVFDGLFEPGYLDRLRSQERA